MKTPVWILIMATALAAAPAVAQEPGGGMSFSALQAVLALPKAVQEARGLGVPDSDIRAILETARERRVPAGVVTEVILGENEAIREHGPIDNFGAFVQARLNEGLRGRDLAAAIRAEHAAHGKGKGKAMGAGDAEGKGAKGASVGKGGKPESPGKSESAGKPGSPGKSRDADKGGAVKGEKGGPR